MTDAALPVRSRYTGNGVTTEFVFYSKVFLATDLKVKVNGILKVLGVDYKVILGLGGQGATAIFLSAPPANPVTPLNVELYSDVGLGQSTNLVEGQFAPEVIETALDRLSVQTRQLAAVVDTTIKAPEDGGLTSLFLPPAQEGSFLRWHNGALENVQAFNTPPTLTLPAYTGNANKFLSCNSSANGLAFFSGTFNLAGLHSSAPSAPVDGDLWYAGAQLKMRRAGATLDVASKSDLVSQATPMGYLYGLSLSNSLSSASMVVSIGTGAARADSNTDDLVLAAVLNKNLNASWTVGNNQGGLISGTVAANKTYDVYVIKRSDTGVVDALFHQTDGSALTLPTNYTLKRRLGSVRTDGGAAIVQFQQIGRLFTYSQPIEIRNTPPSLSVELISAATPPNRKTRWFGAAAVFSTSNASGGRIAITDPDLFAGAVGMVGATDNYDNYPHYGQVQQTTNASGQLRLQCDTAPFAFSLYTLAYEDLSL
jgi:hypothetical protein